MQNICTLVSLVVLINSQFLYAFSGHQRQTSSCDVASWFYGLGMAFLAVAVPSLPCLFGITALFAR